MKFLTEYRNAEVANKFLEEIKKTVTQPWKIMEICGGQTHSLVKHGILSVLPREITMIHGPGCPVCVTSASHMDAFIAMADRENVRVAIFGDLFRVPGTHTSLAIASSKGAKVDIVYSPMDALDIAKNHPDGCRN